METTEEKVHKLGRQVKILTIRQLLISILILAIVLLVAFSCAPTHKMVMPTGCKPPKKVKHEMVVPTTHKHEKKFMVYKPKTMYDYDKQKMLVKTGKIGK